MQTININQISATKGLQIKLNGNDEWLTNILKNVLPTKNIEFDTLIGKIDFLRTNMNIDITGTISFTHHPLCARCGEEITANENIRFVAHLAPLDEVIHKNKDDKEELTKDDMDFSFYSNDTIELEPIVNDEIALEIPYNYYCSDQENCRLHEPTSQNISLNDKTDPRWAPLKNLKIMRK